MQNSVITEAELGLSSAFFFSASAEALQTKNATLTYYKYSAALERCSKNVVFIQFRPEHIISIGIRFAKWSPVLLVQ